MSRNIEISPKTILLIFLFPVIGYILFKLQELLLILFFALIFVAALNPYVTKLHRRKVPRQLAVVIVYLAFVAILLVIISFILPPLYNESVSLLVKLNLSQYIEVLQFSQIQNVLKNYNSLLGQLGTSLQSVIGLVTKTFSSILTVFTFLVVTYYMLVERERMHMHLVWVFGHTNAEERAQRFMNKLEVELGSWVRGEITLMSIIGLCTFIGLTLLGIPFAVPLAILAGLFEAIPNIGPIISCIPAILIASIVVSPAMGLAVLALYVLIQQLENNIIVPRVMSSAVNISPLVAIITIISGLKLAGPLGALLSVPIFIFVRTIIQEYYGGKNPLTSLTDSKK